MKEETLEERLRKLVGVITADTKLIKAGSTTNQTYPLWLGIGPVKDVGVVVEDQLSIADLANRGLADSFPPNLHWAVCPTYNLFEVFLKTWGTPGFVSFDSDLSKAPGISGGSSGKPKDGLDCAKLLIQHCRTMKMPALPAWSCHTPVLTKRNEIEFLLDSYQLKAGKVKAVKTGKVKRR